MPAQGGSGPPLAQAGQSAVDLGGRTQIHHQVGQRGLGSYAFWIPLQQAGADDAAPLPDLAIEEKLQV